VQLLRGIKGHTQALNKNTAGQQQTQKPDPAPIIYSELKLPHEITSRYHADQDKSFTLQRRNFWISLLAFIAVAVYAYITYGQWQTLGDQFSQTQVSLSQVRRSLLLSERQAKAAEQSATSAQQTFQDSRRVFITEQRPYLVVDPPIFYRTPSAPRDTPFAPKEHIVVNLIVRNIGRSPAIKVIDRAYLFPYRDDATRETYFRYVRAVIADIRKRLAQAKVQRSKDTRTGLNPGQDVAPEQSFFTSTKPIVLADSDRISVLMDGERIGGDMRLMLIGIIEYSDAFSELYETEICEQYFGPNPNVWHFCDTTNSIR
jgi:hypothetical protein